MANTKKIQLKIGGMSCAACSATVERALKKVPGVLEAAVNLASGGASVSAEQGLQTAALIAAVEKSGFTASEVARNEVGAQALRFSARQLAIALVFGGLELYVGMSHMLPFPLWLPSFLTVANPMRFALTQLLLTIPVLFCGRSFFLSGVKNLWLRHPNMDSLVTIGTGSAFLYSLYNTFLIPTNPMAVHHLYYESAAVVLALVLLGKFLEERSKNSARSAISSLVSLIPDEAVLLREGRETLVSSSEIVVGDVVVIKPGERVPVDGVILRGSSFLDESLLTGESLPVSRRAGDKVSGGTINKDGLLQVTASSVGADTAIAHIMALVTDAQERKAPIARLADRISGVFVPVVCLIALVAAGVWLLAGKELAFALNVFISVLVVACPCALGLATPIAVMTGSGAGARRGILFRGGDVIEEAARIDAVLFDKTGTITKGQLQVQSVLCAPGVSQEQLLRLAGAAEQGSVHPIAQAILDHLAAQGVPIAAAQSHLANPGMGVTAVLDGTTILAGTPRLFEEHHQDVSKLPPPPPGATCIYLAQDGRYLGLIALTDTVKEESKSAVALLTRLGISSTLLTGDNESSAQIAAEAVGIRRVFAGVLPGGKADEVKKLKGEGRKVAMVGDGINDAPALMTADVGIAVFGGTDAASQSAGILLMSENLRSVPYALELARKTMSIIRLNLFWAFLYNCVGIPLAAGVLYPFTGTLLSPAFAGAAMALSSISVVLNSLRLSRFRPRR